MGMNSRDHPSLLQEFHARHLQDVDVFELGEWTRRSGAISLDSPTDASEPYGVGFWSPPSARTAKKIVGYWGGAASGIQLFESQGDGAWATFDTGVSLVDSIHQFQQGRAFYTADVGAASGVTTGVATLFVASASMEDSGTSFPLSGLVYRHDITTATDRASQTFDVRPRALLWWQGRLWAGNSASTNHGLSWLGWSNVLDGAGGWDDSTQNIVVEPDDNDEITALHSVRGSNNEMYIFKKRSIMALVVYWDTDGFYTESVDILDTTQSQLRTISKGVGCIATRSVQEVTLPDGNADLFFLAHDGIRSIKRAEQDVAAGAGRPVSDIIQPTIDRINFDFAYKATSIVHKNFYLLAVPVDGSTTNNLVIVYDLIHGGFGTLSWNVADWVDSELASLDRRAFFQTRAVAENDSGVSGFHLFQGFTGLEDPGGSAIPFQVETRGFTHEDNRLLKMWDFVEIQAAANTTAATLTVDVKVDEKDWETAGYIGFDPAQNQFPVLPFNLPFTPASQQAQIKALGLLGIDPGHMIEVRIKDEESFAGLSLRNITVVARPFPRQAYTI
jgi:hypothetical protein